MTLGRQRCLRVGWWGDEACRLNGSMYESNIGSLCGWHDHSPPHKAWEKQDQMVVRVQGAPESSYISPLLLRPLVLLLRCVSRLCAMIFPLFNSLFSSLSFDHTHSEFFPNPFLDYVHTHATFFQPITWHLILVHPYCLN